jgi:branched-chain amino acid transport system permease protein
MLAFIIQLIITGFTLGGIYALIAVGLHLVFNATGIFNFAQGALVAWGGILIYLLSIVSSLPLWLAILVGVAGVALISIFLLTPVITCLFAALLLENIAVISLEGNAYSIPPFSGGETLKIVGAGIAPQTFWILASTVLVLLGLFLFFKRTMWGRAMVANADNPEGTKFIGANPSRISLLAFFLGGVMAGIGGVLIAPLTGVKGDVCVEFALKGFAAAMLGGISSTVGVVIGGFLLGLFEAFVGGLISSSLRNAFVFSLIIFVLVLRPTGIMGRRELERV